jgi:serine protease Do
MKKRSFSAGVVALSLSLALIGGTAGGAAAGYYLSPKAAEAPVAAASADTETVQKATSVASITQSSINSIYETYKSAVVGVRNDGTATNVFGQTTPAASSGTGFIISSDGYILTNNHVVENAGKVTVTLYNEKTYDATVAGTDPESDVALLKIGATGLNAVKLGNSDDLVVGEAVFAIGNPLGELTYTVTAGIVSAEDREINENGNPINMFQTDVAINPGNSGGPVFNMNGEVVGIATAKYASGGIEGIGFAIPINDAVKVATQLKETGHVQGHPYLGVSVRDLTGQTNGTGPSTGVYVVAVDPSGGAGKAGIQAGDIITAIGDTTLKSTSDLTVVLKQHAAGESVKVKVYRSGKPLTLTVTLGENKPSV